MSKIWKLPLLKWSISLKKVSSFRQDPFTRLGQADPPYPLEIKLAS